MLLELATLMTFSEPDRVWISEAFFANRLQDWRLRDERLECIEDREVLPFRTCALLTHDLGRDGVLELRVTLGALDDDGPALAGFHLGAGGEGVDHRIAAIAHHKPAPDGGMLCAIDRDGVLSIRDASRDLGGNNMWSVGGRLELAGIPAYASSDPIAMPEGDLVLQVNIDEHDTVRLTAFDASGERLGHVETRVEEDRIEGGIALFSHLGRHWFDDLAFDGDRVRHHPGRAFGPILSAQHTISGNTLTLQAQMPPLDTGRTHVGRLEIQVGTDDWREIGAAELDPDAYTFTFREPLWDASSDARYRVVYEDATYEGEIRAEPDGDFVLAGMSCHKIYTGGLKWNHDSIWFPHADLVENILSHDPDLVYFAGDQIYEGDLTRAERSPPEAARLDYLYKWYRFLWAFRDLLRDRPSIMVPDDHDYYHGNIWGAGGRRAVAKDGMRAQDAGGFTMPPRFVNMVHQTQCGNLPPPFDPTPIEQDISVYYTSVEYGGLSFAVLADRMFKSSATPLVPEAQVVNGWRQNLDFPPGDMDVEDAVLLGDRQLDFLDTWASAWSEGTWMKVGLSQTIFSNVATIPEGSKGDGRVPTLAVAGPGEYPAGDVLAVDTDSNGWPQTGRDEALRRLRKAFAMHIAGDQHLSSMTRYGIDEWRDASFAFCVPAIANTFPRRWFPPVPGLRRDPTDPDYTGDFEDGFGNKVTVLAVGNPQRWGVEPALLHERSPGYGIIRFERESRDIVCECWPRFANMHDEDPPQYPGWPIRFNQLDNYGRLATHWLPTIEAQGEPVIRVVREDTGELVYAVRMSSTRFRPGVFEPGVYTIEVEGPTTRVLSGLEARTNVDMAGTRRIRF